MASSLVFSKTKDIRFHHCDPAGIVFYPQYMVLCHEFIEDWFTEGLGIPYPDLVSLQRLGIPTVRLECNFRSPSRLGDKVAFSLRVKKLGNSSIQLDLTLAGRDSSGAAELRLEVEQSVVLVSLETGRPVELCADYRERMARFLEACADQ
ncbi:MAG: thioesterase family protein [Pseudomonadota bacterium]